MTTAIDIAEHPVDLDHQLDEWHRCRRDLMYWLRRYVKVMAKEGGQRIPFEPYPGQIELFRKLVQDKWVWMLKSRRIGATGALLAWAVHQVTFWPDYQVIMVSQDKPTAVELISWFTDIDMTQPEWMRQVRKSPFTGRKVDNTEQVVFLNGSSIRAVAGSSRAARSLNCDFLIIDEAAYVQYLDETLSASLPTLEAGGGVVVVVSTSHGPGNRFERGFWAAKGEYVKDQATAGTSAFDQMFLNWRHRPGRDDAWRARMGVQLGAAARYEYPSKPEEAFEAGADRMFPNFSMGDHVVHCERPKGAQLYRAMDFGSTPTSAFVCLWAWHDPDSIPRLTFELGCETIEESPETIGEYAAGISQMVAYTRNDNGKRIKLNDDLPDALRYLVMTYRFFGHVHVYRVLFLRSGSQSGSIQYSPQEWFRRIMLMSGWELMDTNVNLWRPTREAENYAGSVGDRSGTGYMNILREQQHKGGFDMPISPHKAIEGVSPDEQVEQGVQWLNCLLGGEYPIHAERYVHPREKMREAYLRGDYKPTSLHDRRRVERMRDLMGEGTRKVRLLT